MLYFRVYVFIFIFVIVFGDIINWEENKYIRLMYYKEVLVIRLLNFS